MEVLSRVGVSMSKFDLWRVKFWLFFGKKNRAQRIILDGLRKEFDGK